MGIWSFTQSVYNAYVSREMEGRNIFSATDCTVSLTPDHCASLSKVSAVHELSVSILIHSSIFLSAFQTTRVIDLRHLSRWL